MDKESMQELLAYAQADLEEFYISGSDSDIEITENFCAYLERSIAELE